MSSHFFQGSLDATLESVSQPPKRARSVTLKLTDTASGYWLPECLTATSTPPPSTEMLLVSTGDPGVDAWIQSAAASLVRIFPSRENGKGSKKATAAASGSSSPASFAKWSPAGFLSRTSQDCLFEESTLFSGRWPKW